MEPAVPSYYYWGPPTARLNFGEVDHLESAYIAEPYNTVSSLVFTALGLVGLRSARRAGLPGHAVAAHAAMAVTGLASALFHATLLFHWHIFDEVAESWMVLVLLYTTLMYTPLGQPDDDAATLLPRCPTPPPPPPRPFRWRLFLLHGLAMSLLIFQVMGFCEVHLVAVAGCVVWRVMRAMRAQAPLAGFAAEAPLAGFAAEAPLAGFAAADRTTPGDAVAARRHRQLLAQTLRRGSIFLALGIASWLLEIACADTIAGLQVAAMRDSATARPVAAFLPVELYALAGWRLVQLHACWHLFMGIATYLMTVVVVVLGLTPPNPADMTGVVAIGAGMCGVPLYVAQSASSL